MPRERDRKRASAGDRRQAGAALARLGWLEGYPDDHGWRRLDDDAVVPLDGAAVAKARRTARTVMREHPEGLAKVVGDVDRWWATVDAKLAWMSAAISGKGGAFDPLPLLSPRLATALRGLLPSPVGGAARAVAIGLAGRPDRLAELIAWLADHRDLTFAELPLPADRVVLALARLAVVGERGKARAVRERGVDALIRLCRIDAPNAAAALQDSRAAENRLRRQTSTRPVAVEPTRSRALVVPWLVRLATRDPSHRQRVLATLAELRLVDALEPWLAWERAHAVLLARAASLADATFETTLERATAEATLITKLEKARAAAPVEVSIRDVLLELDLLASDVFARVQPSLVRVLAALPAAMGVAAPARMLLHGARAAATADGDEHVEWVWDALADALERGAPLELLAPWRGIFKTDRRLYVESDFLDHATRRSEIERAFRVVVALAWTGTLGEADVERACTWLGAGLTDEELEVELVVAMRGLDARLGIEAARATLALAPRELPELVAVARLVLEASDDWRYATTAALCTLIEHAAATGGGWIVRAALAEGQAASLAEIGEMLALMPRARWPRLTREVAAPWIARYPAALHAALHRLASVDPDAERTAARRLASDLPDPAALRDEIAALRGRLDRAGAATRLANLEARLAHPRPPSAARLATLAGKLERSARDIAIRRLSAELVDGASARVCRAFGLPELPAWARDRPRTIRLLVALLELDARDRELAGRLIRARGGDPPWDLRDEPANRAFLDAARAAGIDTAPWLDDTPRVVREADGKSFTLALTGDPIEVFAMGEHFGTCLSPDGGNFFSVVGNAADINKRVLYARRDGRVIGRCLLALTDQFAILAFHVYCHEAIRLDDHVRDFVLDLATRMHAIAVPRGTVRKLLARDWYDDGPRDLVGRLRALDAAGLDFATLAPAAVVDVVRAALDRAIDDVTLPMILGHQGLHHRPELVIPFAPYILASTVPTTRLVAAQLALRAGDRALADRFLGDHHAGGNWLVHNAWYYGETLAQLRPSHTLARLRATRRGRRWDDEPGDRCAVAGVALEALKRPKQAAAMYRLALREAWLEDELRARLEALGET